MKKYIYIILIIIFIVLLIPKAEDELRIRVIANSNSEVDQELKMKVVSVLLEEINSYENENIIDEIKNNLENLDACIKRVLKDKEYNINIQKMRFPPKELNGEIIKGGKYLTLVVVIENGEGKNWWSLLSPSFRTGFEDNETGDIEFKFYFYEEIKKSFK